MVLETALEKDRDRRYQTALDFAEDLRRVRQREPIVARPVGPIVRLRRWAQRNPGARRRDGALVFLLLAGGLVVTTSLLGVYWAERKAKTDALEEQTKIAAYLKIERDAKEAALRNSEGLRLAQESHGVR